MGRPAPELAYLARLESGVRAASGRLDYGPGPTVVNFWATWCPPCVAELPLLEEFRGERGVRVVGVLESDPDDLETELADLEEFLTKHDVEGPQLLTSENGPVFGTYGVRSMPSSVLVDTDGTVLEFGAGMTGTKRLLERAAELDARRAPG